MHSLQPKHVKLKVDEVKKLLTSLNISLSQIPKVTMQDAVIPEGSRIGDVFKIERREGDKTVVYYRVVVA